MNCVISLREILKNIPSNINNMLLSILEAKDDYVEAPILLQKIANYSMNSLIQFCSYIYTCNCYKWLICKCYLFTYKFYSFIDL